MKFGHICRESVLAAIRQFDRIGQADMLKKYGGGSSKKLYIRFKVRLYDQKLIFRAAHIHAKVADGWKCTPHGLEELLAKFKFTSDESKRHLKKLKFKVMDIKSGKDR